MNITIAWIRIAYGWIAQRYLCGWCTWCSGVLLWCVHKLTGIDSWTVVRRILHGHHGHRTRRLINGIVLWSSCGNYRSWTIRLATGLIVDRYKNTGIFTVLHVRNIRLKTEEFYVKFTWGTLTVG